MAVEDFFLEDKMDFEDPMAFSHFDCSVSAEPLPMNKITSLSDIWLPSYLLPNRGKFVTSNSNKPGIFRTLEKRTITDCFSIYSEPDSEANESENCSSGDDSADEFSQADMLDLLNDYSSPSTNDNTTELFDTEKSNFSSESQVASSQLQNCSSYQDLDHSPESKAFLNSQQEEFSLYEKSVNLPKNQMKYDLSDTNKVPIVRAISDSLKDSLEEVYNSENEDCTDFDAISDLPSNTLSQQFERIEIGNLNDMSRSQEKQSEVHQSGNMIPSDCLKSLEDDFSVEKLQIDDTENVCVDHFTYPIVYQKPVIEEVVSKQKKQKVKKNKASRVKKTLIVNTLEDNSADYDEPLVDHFYEHVMRQESHKSYTSEFPSLHKESKINYIGNQYTFEGQTPESNWSTDADVTYEQPEPTNEFQVTQESVRFEHKDEGQNTNTIVIENIPVNVTDTQLHSTLLGFGELKNISMRRCGKYNKAELRMDSSCDVEWIVDCLNGQQPFGTTTEPLKCYKLC